MYFVGLDLAWGERKPTGVAVVDDAGKLVQLGVAKDDASIRAALYPETVPYLYFVAIPDGHHLFSRSLEEHEKAVATARRLRKAQEDSLRPR